MTLLSRSGPSSLPSRLFRGDATPTPHRWPPDTLLARLPDDARRRLLGISVVRSYAAGCLLVRQGDPGTCVYVLLDGLVKVTASTENGAESLLGIRVRGDVIGEMAVLDGTSRFATVQTCGPVDAAVIQGEEFLNFLERFPEVSITLNRMITGRLRWSNRRRLDSAGYDVDIQLARVLFDLARRHGQPCADGVDIGLRLSQQELGMLIGAKLSAVEKALRQLSSHRLVTRGHRRIVITDPDALASFADLDLRFLD